MSLKDKIKAQVAAFDFWARPWAERSRWQGWAGGPGGGWNKPPTPLWPDRVGEMSIRQIDGIARSETLIGFRVHSRYDLDRMFSVGMDG